MAIAAASVAATAISMPVFGQQQRRGGTLRLVPSTDLVFLDPVYASALVSVQHGYHVFDTLYGVDHLLNPHPQMVENQETSADGRTWTIHLRPGLMFHDGQPVRARDCVASLDRWSKRDNVGRVVASFTERYEVLDDKTFRVHLKEPFPRLMNAYGKPHIAPAFIMPERLAQTPPDKPITEMVGSGPYRFLDKERKAGSFVAYERFDGYVPRSEPADWTSGGKVANFDRVEWHVIRDQSTAVAAMQRGEVDWMESMSADLLPIVEADKTLGTQHDDPFGKLLVMRFNHLQPPFNNVKLRRFMMNVIKQEDFYSTLNGGNPDLSQDCAAMMPCTLPDISQIGKDQYGKLNGKPKEIAAALKETGYNGEKIVILNASDSLVIAPLGRVAADTMTRAGLNIDLQEMDFGTLLQRLNSQAPVESGGWSLYCTAWPTVSISDPIQNLTLRGEGKKGWVGWYESAQMEQLVQDWIRAPTPAAQLQVQRKIHELALADVPTLSLGMFKPNMAYRSNLQGILPGSVRYPWNVRRA